MLYRESVISYPSLANMVRSRSVQALLRLEHINDRRSERTCFANPLSYLTRLSGPIRNSLELLPENHAVNAPREIIKLIDWLMTNAGDVVCDTASCCHRMQDPDGTSLQDDLFMSPAEAELVDTIREVPQSFSSNSPN
jgi:hypothetical protein